MDKTEMVRSIVIFGASGGTGHQLVNRALQQGYHVKAFVRDPEKLKVQHDRLICHQGDVADYQAVLSAVNGSDAVLCVLGASTPLKRDSVIVEGVRNIIKAMEQTRVSRLIYLSFLGVRESRKDLGLFLNYVVAPLLHNVLADHEVKEELIKQSSLDWTIVRPPKLTDGRFTGTYRAGEKIRPSSFLMTISRADVADFMLRQVNDPAFIKKAPLVMI